VLPASTLRERLELHALRLRQQGASYVLDTISSRVETELRNVTTLLRRPVAKLFPYHFRLENIADTWIEAAAVYRPTPYAGDAMLFRAGTPSALVSGTALKLDAQNGWGPYVLGGVTVDECPGDHNTMCEEPHVRVLARRLRAYLDRRIAAQRAEERTSHPVTSLRERVSQLRGQRPDELNAQRSA